MVDISAVLRDGAIYSLSSGITVLLILAWNPRLFLQDYPKAVQAAVPPKSPQEKRLSLILCIPWVLLLVLLPLLFTWRMSHAQAEPLGFAALFLHAFGVLFSFNLVDLLLLDWLLFCTIRPRFMAIPGTEGMAAYGKLGYHFRGFLVGTVLSAVGGLLIAGLLMLF